MPETVELHVVYDGTITGAVDAAVGPPGPMGPQGAAGPQGAPGSAAVPAVEATPRGVLFADGAGWIGAAPQVQIAAANELRVWGGEDRTGAHASVAAAGGDGEIGVVSGAQSLRAKVAAAIASFIAAGSSAVSATLSASTRSAQLRIDHSSARYVEAYADANRGQVRISHAPSAGEEAVRQIDTALVLRTRAVRVDAGVGTPEIIVPCAAGEIVTGGGAVWTSGSAARFWIASSGPMENAGGWSARGMNNTTGSNVLRVHAICRKRLGGISVVESREDAE
jgi:hypothetical protein